MAHAHPTKFSRNANWRLTLVLLAMAIGLTVAAFAADDACMHWMRAHQNRVLAFWASKVSNWGDWPELMVYGSVALIIAWVRRAGRLVHLILCMMLASTIAGVAANSVRLLSG